LAPPPGEPGCPGELGVLAGEPGPLPDGLAGGELRVQRHILPALGYRRLDVLTRSPSIIQAWAANLPVGPSYAQQLLADLSGILEQAVTDSLIPRNPVKAAKIRAPRVVRPKIVPWTAGQVDAIRGELPGRYKAMTDTGRYLGLRQGEIFGLSLDEIDWLHRVVHVEQTEAAGRNLGWNLIPPSKRITSAFM
jgi:integrase